MFLLLLFLAVCALAIHISLSSDKLLTRYYEVLLLLLPNIDNAVSGGTDQVVFVGLDQGEVRDGRRVVVRPRLDSTVHVVLQCGGWRVGVQLATLLYDGGALYNATPVFDRIR